MRRVVIASTVENESTVHHHSKGKVGFTPLLGSYHNAMHSTNNLRTFERGGAAALLDVIAQTVAHVAMTNYRLTWEAIAGSDADVILAGPHSVPECLAVAQKLNIPVAVAAAYPFDAQFESTGGHHLTRSARAVEWAAVNQAVNQFRATLGLRPQEQEESSHIPFIAGYSLLFSQLPVPPPTTSNSISGFWRVAPETFTSSPPLDAFLAAGAPPVFVGFGNSPLPRPAQPYTAIAASLKALNLRGLFAAPSGATSFDGLGDHIFVVSEKIPLEWAMARSAAAIHHGGPTSIAASLSAGIPTIILPVLPESYSAAHRLSVLGVGPRSYVPLLEVTEAAISKSLAEVQKPSVKELSRELGARLQAEDGIPAAMQFISNLMATYKSARHIRMEWQPDEEAADCTLCHSSWSLFNRRHHCRSCGFIFCSNCVAAAGLLNHRLPQLVCKTCTATRSKKPDLKKPAAKPAAPDNGAAPAKPPAAEPAKPPAEAPRSSNPPSFPAAVAVDAAPAVSVPKME